MMMTQLYIGGIRISADGPVTHISNPATGKVLAELPTPTAIDIDRAVQAATHAATHWRAIPIVERCAALAAAADALQDVRERIEILLIAEAGLTVREARASVDCGLAELRQPRKAIARPAPTVRAVLGPSSSPVWPMMRDIAAALAAGEAVIAKPPAGGWLTHLELAQIWESLPAGVVNVIPGDAAIGQQLLACPQVNAVALTGSRAVGLSLNATDRSLWIDDGGTDAVFVRRGADLDAAVRAIVWSRLRHGGRACVSSRRIYVDAAVAEDFTVRLHQYAGVLEVDDPSKPASMLGPMLSAAAAKACEGRVVKTMRGGGRLVLGGFRFRPSGLSGYWLQQTILTDVTADSLPMREEMGGPVLTVTPVEDDGAIADSLTALPSPLAVAVFDRDPDAGLAWWGDRPVRALWLNTPMCAEQMPGATSSAAIHRPAASAGVGTDYYISDQLLPEVS
jgi:acyl-CoA reductase-like NAD-dependent aldehyde dehydrogenase